MSAIIIDGNVKSALATVRSLGRQGVSITCGAERGTAMGSHSKYVSMRFVYVSPKKSQERFIADVVTQAKTLLARDKQKPVLYCFSDATSLTIARNFQKLQQYVEMPLPSIESIEIAADKKKTYELAQQLSIPTITTYSETEFSQVQFPCVVKNTHSIVWEEGKGISGTASFVFSLEELLSQYRTITDETGEEPLVQEFIEGDEYGVEMLCDNGSVLCTFAHKRIRSLSPRGGAAVVKETAQSTQEVELMKKYAASLVTSLMWHGPVMVEFKIDRNNGAVKLMEINGRFWGSLPLAVQAGVDFPMEYYKLAQGEVVERSSAFQPSLIRTRHFLGDCKWLFGVLFAKDSLRKALYPSRLRALWDFKIELFKSKGDVFDVRDLAPSWFEYIDILNKWQQR